MHKTVERASSHAPGRPKLGETPSRGLAVSPSQGGLS